MTRAGSGERRRSEVRSPRGIGVGGAQTGPPALRAPFRPQSPMAAAAQRDLAQVGADTRAVPAQAEP